MNVVNYTDFRLNLKKRLDAVSDSNDLLVINRPDNKNVVLISLQEYNALQETLHVLSSEKNRIRLAEAIDRTNKGIVETHSLID
ncbi:MAG: type II toxin-antitoxin system Phd/YefM family antitoxin [Bacteroidetes bacterium]|nr:MAG: type II toxin-antitoxin system Phd/YefM family antitoxin [Bacteroidota bacterium]